METTKKETRGGARTGAGRPKKEPTKILGIRVPEAAHSECKEAVYDYLKSRADVWKPITNLGLLDLGFEYVTHPHGDAKAWFRYELDTCILFVQLSGRVTIDDNHSDGEVLLLEDANINQVRILLKALQ